MTFPFDQYDQLDRQHRREIVSTSTAPANRPPKYAKLKIPFEQIMASQDDQKMKRLTNFICAQFNDLFDIVKATLEQSKSNNESLVPPKIRLLMTLVWLKHSLYIYRIANDFGVSKSYAAEIIWSTIDAIRQPLKDHMIKWTSISELASRNHQLFTDFPFAVGAVDATIQSAQVCPLLQKNYYSGKSKLHCIKSQVVVNPEGKAIAVATPFAGADHDLDVLRKSDLIARMNAETDSLRRFNILYEAQIHADRGYTGLSKDIPGAIVMKRKPKNGDLSADDERENDTITHSRVIVENWFGRLKRLFKIMTDEWRFNLGSYGKVFEVCASLTNFHIEKKPLRAKDHTYFRENGDDNEEEQ